MFGKSSASEIEILKLCNDVCILDEIKSFNDGLDTYIGEGGATLSGGQKQRIVLARALIKKPQILLLDDALSNVDVNTEKIIMEYILQNFKKSLVIIISNRLSVLDFCKKIYVLKNGFLIEEGNSNTLLNQRGEFYKLFASQLDNR